MVDKQGYGPDLRNFMNLKLNIKLNAERRITGVLRGYDQFMNLVLEDCNEVSVLEKKNPIGTVMVRGNSIVMWECLDKIPLK